MDDDERKRAEEVLLDLWEEFNGYYEDADPQEYSRIQREILERREKAAGIDIDDLLPPPVREPYKDKYLRSRHWELTRTEKLRSARGLCEGCGERATEVHHKHYKSLGAESMNDLESLCSACHRKRHGTA